MTDDADCEAAIRDCHRLYREPEYAKVTVPVLLRQLDAAWAEIAERGRRIEQGDANLQNALAIAIANAQATEAAEARVAVLREALRTYGRHLDKCTAGPVTCECGLYAALAKEPPR